jgi:cysteine desulfurase/selenocysteine lyase
MTTSEPSLAGLAPPASLGGASLPSGFAGLEALAAQSVGAPDPALIAKLANQFFAGAFAQQGSHTGTPNLASVPNAPTSPQPLASSAPAAAPVPSTAPLTAPLSAATGGPSFPGLPSLPADLLSFVPPRAISPPSPTAIPASVPAGSFYFVDEALAAAGSGASPFQVGSLPVRHDVTQHRPDRAPELGFGARPFDPRAIRADFPILQEQVNGKPLIWLDNAATTQKPQAVIDRLSYFYEHENSNIHRAAHTLAARSTDAYEAAREKVRRFINASSVEEIVFVRGTTEAINLVAQSWGRRNIEPGDEIIVTWLEHHANIVPWQQLAAEKGAKLRVAPVDDDGQIILEEYEKLFNSHTKIASFTQVSNALGTVTPAREMVEIAHRHGALALVDGAQSVSHMRADVQALDADFFVFSGHKVFGPTGIGVVYGKHDILEAMPPWQGGGNMIADVTFEKTIYQPAPAKFEAGTGNIADAVGLGAALDYVSAIGIENITRYEHELLAYATRGLLTIPGLKLIGTAKEKAGVLSFVLDGFRTEDVGAALDKEGIAVRSGHHCAQPILRRFGLESTVRPSLAPYNTCEDIDALVNALLRIQSGRR